MLLDALFELTAARALDGDEQFVAHRRQAKALLEFLPDAQQQVGGGFRVGQGPMEALHRRQAQHPHQGAQFVIGRLGKNAPGQEQGTGEVPFLPAPDPA